MCVSRLTKVIVMLALVFYALASMHCILEGVPGFGFLKICCFVDSGPAAPRDCDTDQCSPVEDGKYRPEECTVSAPQPILVLALISPAPPPDLQNASPVPPQTPIENPGPWQFSQRAALSPRAPSIAA